MPFWRLSITRGVLIAACAAVVVITMLKNHFILAAALTLIFAIVAWMARRDVVVDKTERMNSFYRSLARVDAGSSNQRFTGGPVGRWASTLRKEDYAVVAGRIADAAKRSDEAADELLREIYDRSPARADEKRSNAGSTLTATSSTQSTQSSPRRSVRAS